MAVYRMRPTDSWVHKNNTRASTLCTLESSCRWPLGSLIHDPHRPSTPSLVHFQLSQTVIRLVVATAGDCVGDTLHGLLLILLQCCADSSGDQ